MEKKRRHFLVAPMQNKMKRRSLALNEWKEIKVMKEGRSPWS